MSSPCQDVVKLLSRALLRCSRVDESEAYHLMFAHAVLSSRCLAQVYQSGQ